MVENLVQIELAYINTKHPDFHEATLMQKSVLSGDISEKINIPKINEQQTTTSKAAEPSKNIPNSNSSTDINVNGGSSAQNGIFNDISNLEFNGLSFSSQPFHSKISARPTNSILHKGIGPHCISGINLLPEVFSSVFFFFFNA